MRGAYFPLSSITVIPRVTVLYKSRSLGTLPKLSQNTIDLANRGSSNGNYYTANSLDLNLPDYLFTHPLHLSVTMLLSLNGMGMQRETMSVIELKDYSTWARITQWPVWYIPS